MVWSLGFFFNIIEWWGRFKLGGEEVRFIFLVNFCCCVEIGLKGKEWSGVVSEELMVVVSNSVKCVYRGDREVSRFIGCCGCRVDGRG